MRQPSAFDYLFHPRRWELAELDEKLDMQDAEIDALRRIAWEETAERLRRLGYSEEKLKPPPRRHRSETRCSRHPGPAETEHLIAVEQGREYRRNKGRTDMQRHKRRYELPMDDGSAILYDFYIEGR